MLDLTIVIYGAIHGLILLPILLSLYGGDGMLLLSEFNENGFVWDWPRSEQGLLIEDRDSFDQVLVTDMPPSHGR
jgi:Niemann-Pick C1 protein